MQIKIRRNHGLAFLAALIIFILIVAVVGLAVAILAKVAHRAVEGGPNQNTPTTDTFCSTNQLEEIPGITLADVQALMATSANTNAEFEFRVLRSTNLVDWEEIIHTNTTNHQLIWSDPNPPYPNGFYKPQIFIP